MTQPSEETPQTDLFPVRLLKNYRPGGVHEIVGYHQPEKTQKNAAGQLIVVQKAEFIEGRCAPPPYPGVGFDTKIWADTVIRLPLDEAKTLIARKIAERADALAA